MRSILSILILVFVVTIIGYSDDDTNKTVIGKWKLIQVLADPGDGSGVFTDVASDKTLTFFSDSTFISNRNMCNMFDTSDMESSGSFTEDKLIINNCEALAVIFYMYEVNDEFLEVNFLCIEPCAEKYLKIE